MQAVRLDTQRLAEQHTSIPGDSPAAIVMDFARSSSSILNALAFMIARFFRACSMHYHGQHRRL